MEKFINGGIVKEMTVYYKKDEEKLDVLDHLSNFFNLDLYEMKEYDYSIYLELKEDVLRENILSFLDELDVLGIYEESEMSDKIESIQENLKKDGCVLDNCDEIFKDRYRMVDQFSFYNDRFDMDILYYAFYFDGPFQDGEFNGLLKYMHFLNQQALDNPLKGAICFGFN